MAWEAFRAKSALTVTVRVIADEGLRLSVISAEVPVELDDHEYYYILD